MDKVFISEPVAAVIDLYDGLVDERSWQVPVRAQLERLAHRLLSGHQQRHPGAVVEIRNWAPGPETRSANDVFALPFSLNDALATVGRGHGFSGWPVSAATPLTGDPEFERVLEILLAGDLAGLSAALDGAPDLVRRRSHYGHKATLLHYLAANGTETYRQRVPMNCSAMVSLLLARGADAFAVADMYGAAQTIRGLLVTSGHPAKAGVTPDLLRILDGSTAP